MLERMELRRRVLLVLLVVFTCVGCDQATKRIALDCLPRAEPLRFAGDTLRLQVVENRGAFLGLGDELPEPVRELVLGWLVGACLAGFLVYLLRARGWSGASLAAGALIVGGGLGNLVDRLARSGYVLDFVNCGIGSLRTGIFNVADVALTLGVVLLALRRRPPELT